MKNIELTLSITLIFSLLLTINLTAQDAVLPSGGEAIGSGGSCSYSVGQVFYQTNFGSNGTVSQGVQHPYEFWMNQGTCEGDADGNGVVNILDLVVISGNFGCVSGCVSGDANFDGVVNVLDLVATSSNFGIICP